MTILIAKANQQILLNYFPNAKFIESSRSTCQFNVRPKTFEKALPLIKADGYNPYALMTF